MTSTSLQTPARDMAQTLFKPLETPPNHQTPLTFQGQNWRVAIALHDNMAVTGHHENVPDLFLYPVGGTTRTFLPAEPHVTSYAQLGLHEYHVSRPDHDAGPLLRRIICFFALAWCWGPQNKLAALMQLQ